MQPVTVVEACVALLHLRCWSVVNGPPGGYACMCRYMHYEKAPVFPFGFGLGYSGAEYYNNV